MGSHRRTWLIFALSALPVLGRAQADDRPLRAVIDAHVRAAQDTNKISPPAKADDSAFVRRIHLDLVGATPSYAETVAFLADTDADKRSKLIDKLLADPRFAEQQAAVWDLTFFGRHTTDSELLSRRDPFRKWLLEKFVKNEPYDAWVRELLTAEGSTSEQNPTMFHAQFRANPEEAAVAVSRLFLGTQLQCARCHDHPFDKWTQMDFYGFAGFFARNAFAEGSVGGKRHYVLTEKTTGEVLFTAPAAQQKAGQKGQPVPAKFLGGAVLVEPPLPKDFKEPEIKGIKKPIKPLFSRKAKAAEWIASPTNPWFARAIANRVFAQYLGRGLVNPVDDLGDNSTVSHPELLDALAAQMVSHKFDLKWYIRELVNSAAYQAAAEGPSKAAAPEWFERARVRPLSAEEMIASLRVATGFDDAAKAAGEKADESKLPGSMMSYTVRYFGEPLNGQGDFQAGLGEHMFWGNSPQVRQIIRRKKGNLSDTIMSSSDPWEKRVERMFLAVLSRRPNAAESKAFVEYVSSDTKSETRVEEAIWVLLNGAEFRFNH